MKLGMEELAYIKVVENMTKARVKDCVVSDGELIIVVQEGDMGLAIGRNGDHINQVREKIGKKISIIEFSPDMEKFTRNLFNPAVLTKISMEDGVLTLKAKDEKRIIGKNGKRINRAKELLNRHFGVKDIIIESGE
ncbi:MAG: NusA-like transcription termination signal-binding factor [Candidatus Diapherotrites archaeon]|nr:NusA-like transcription termination signal-binding factor [Candidatus Diapherotrites archaeon]